MDCDLDQKDDNPLGEMISRVLTMKGVPKQKHIGYTGRILDITTAAAHKKLSGASKWEVSQLIKVIKSIDMEMSDFFDMYSHTVTEIHEATWSDGKIDLPCKIYLSDEGINKVTEYSALKINDDWFVVRTDEIKDSFLFESKRNIKYLHIYPRTLEAVKRRIAILDDEKIIVDCLKDIISKDCYSVDTFYKIEDMENSLNISPYDAYILDWVIGDKTVFNTIKKIRQSQKKNSMILVLTGQLEGIVDQEISHAIHDYDITGPYEKPVRGNLIKSNLDKYFSK